ncbi:MAG: hypothetical protein ABIA02_04210 [Candidatus Falkowbacteria bacterium]
MLKILKKHKIIIFASLFISFIYGCHHIFIPNFINSDELKYSPITTKSSYDEAKTYAPRAREVYSGDFIADDINIQEHKNSPAVLPILNPIITGSLARLLGNFELGLIASDFIFPALIFLIVFLIAYELSQSKEASVLFSTIFIFSPGFGLSFPPISIFTAKRLIGDFLPFLHSDLLYFSRIEYPKITFIFYALAFYFLLRVLKYGKKKDIIFSGISSGILFYTYLYDWIYFFGGLLILLILLLIFKEYKILKKIILVITIGLVVSVFYWYNFIELHSMSHYSDIILRAGVEISHNLRILTWKTYLRAIALILILWMLFRKTEKIKIIYLSSFLAPIIFVLNLQVITGFNPQPDHWHRTQFLVVSLTIFFIIFNLLKKYLKNTRIIKKIGLYYVLIILIGMLYSQYCFSKDNINRFTLPIYISESYEWLNENTEVNSVVGTPNIDTNFEISLYTDNKIFLPYGLNTLANENEIWERMMIIYKIFDISTDEFSGKENGLSGNKILEYLFHNKYSSKEFNIYFSSVNEKTLPENMFNEKISEYDNFIFDINKNPYKLDYLLVNEEKIGSQVNKEYIPYLKKVFDNNRIKIFKIK